MKVDKFFTGETFGTLAGCAVVAWLVTSVISGVFGINVKYIGFFASIGVAYIAMFCATGRKPVQYAIAFVNGCLIYTTIVGGTSFMPYVNTQTAGVVQEMQPGIAEVISRPWHPDPNLVSATKTSLAINENLSAELSKIETKNEKIRSLVRQIPTNQISPIVRGAIEKEASMIEAGIDTVKGNLRQPYNVLQDLKVIPKVKEP